jgi:hypothetical protein
LNAPDRRKFERFTVPTILEIEDLGIRQRVGTSDISASGCQVWLRQKLATNATIEVKVEIQGAGHARGTAKVAWEDAGDARHVGVVFGPELTEALLPILRKLVM